MIYDCCPIFNELDLLELRMEELFHVVDRFVIAEATHTHAGAPKPLHLKADYAANPARWAPFGEKIIYVVVEDMPEGEGIAAVRRREMWQRNALLKGLAGAKADDVVLISDCDELPRASLVPPALPDGTIVAYIQCLYYYNFNTFAPDRPWPGTRAARYADVKALTPHVIRNGLGQPDQHYPTHAHLKDAGWHFSYFGGVEKIQEKMSAFLHQELVSKENSDERTIEARMRAGIDVWGRTWEQQFRIGPATDLPFAVLKDPMRWRSYFHPDWKPCFHEDWYSGEQAVYIAHLAKQSPAGACVEIGAWEGKSTIALAQLLAPRVLHVVDHWLGNEGEGEEHPSVSLARQRDVHGTFQENVRTLTGGNIREHWGTWQAWAETWKEGIAFLHLDASHDRASVRDCLNAIKPFLVPGAILCGDDYEHESVALGVADALGENVEGVHERLWVWRNA
jgi:beta-1,4-mannosyl-glycoprotein beta-1,4-N-acetylglucosaminyltransferase